MMHDLHLVALVFHLIAMVLGLGGATATDALFVAAVRARKVGKTLTFVMDTLSKLVVAGFLLLVVSGVGLILTGTDPTPRFWAKMLVVAIIGVNGYLAHKKVFPKLACLMSKGRKDISLSFLHLISATAAISATSWYAALIIGTLKIATIPFAVWVGGYLGMLALAVLGAVLMTPKILRVEDPEFNTVFPVLVGAVERSVSGWAPPKVDNSEKLA